MKFIFYSLCTLALWAAIPSATLAKSDKEVPDWTVEKIDETLQKASHQALLLARNLENDSTALPASFIDGQIRTTSYRGWVCGFFSGLLWMLSEEFPQNEELRRYAELYTERVESVRYFKDNHDIGFMLNCSFGQAYRVTKDPKYLFPLFDGAKNLSERFMPGAGVTLSWHRNDKWRNPVIIDNMMNLELLEFAGQKQGIQTYLDIADTHAHTTMRNHYRPNFSTWHVIDYDEVTGEVLHRNTAQGYSDESDWARGQAWGLYGFTMMYQMTGRPEYLAQASHVGNYLLTRSNMPEDLVPYWDYDCPDIPNTIRDASSASIMASAFLQLSLLDIKKSDARRWMQAAQKQLASLSSDTYTAKPGEMGGFILMHSTGSKPANSEMDVPIIYADYYYVEALLRLKRILANPSLTASRSLPMQIYQIAPLTKVLPNETEFTDHKDTLHVARGENATFQFVVTASQDVYDLKAQVGKTDLGEVRSGWLHDVYSSIAPKDAEDLITSPNKTFPDPIINDQREVLAANGHKTLCIDIDIPRDATPGLHRCNVTINAQRLGKTVKAKKEFFIKVYPVTLPEKQQLKVVNWFSTAQFKYMNGGIQPKNTDPIYFDFIRQIAEMGARYGQNCWLMNEHPDIVLTPDGKDFRLDFTRYDKIMDILLQFGNLQYVCNGHLGGRASSDWSKPMHYHLTTVKDGKLINEYVPYDDPRLPEYIQKYYSQVEAHFREKGWLDICYQHIADEPEGPGTINQQSWSTIAALVKKAAPGLRTIDASFEIIDQQDVSVILLGDNIDSMPAVPDGCERWLYTCCGPQGNFANRFIQLPLIKTRIIHWLNYRYNEAGYLHWGMNYWECCNDPNFDLTCPTGWPGGDTHIVYPGYHKLYPCLRFCTMRDGIHDYELLKMIEASNPQKAKELCNEIIQAGNKYNTDITHFMGVRRQMLEFLSNLSQ